MNNYSKTEKSCGKEKWSAIGCGISSYFEILMWLAVILYTIYLIWPDVTCLITEPYSGSASWTSVIVFGVLGINRGPAIQRHCLGQNIYRTYCQKQ